MRQQSGWQLAGTAPESYEHHNIVAFLETSKDLVALAGLRAGERVLDVACETGVLARLAANAVGPAGKVAGADLNEAMLAMARIKAEQAGLSIEWRACDAAELSFPDQTFDAALCQWGLEFFSDRPRALRQIARVLAPGGRLVVRVWRALERQPFYVALLDALERHLGPGSSGPIRAAFALSDPHELRSLVKQAGFSRVHLLITTNLLRFPSLERYVPGYLAATPIAARLSTIDDRGRAALMSDVANALQSFVDDDGLAAPVENHVVVAYK